ncbi:hypothetical protein PSP6_80038 [Paraburkholderia tropica]|nr:hypothetical protein PSP6_80038 [Paraburkholderia tropica]
MSKGTFKIATVANGDLAKQGVRRQRTQPDARGNRMEHCIHDDAESSDDSAGISPRNSPGEQVENTRDRRH